MSAPLPPASQRACQFCLLASFDAHAGATLRSSYPFATGLDEQLLAQQMIPDGMHQHDLDWTVLVRPVSALSGLPYVPREHPHVLSGRIACGGGRTHVYILNLSRTLQDERAPRGSRVLSMAVGTMHPHVTLFRAVLVLALDEYVATGDVAVLDKLYRAANGVDLYAFPCLSRVEKLALHGADECLVGAGGEGSGAAGGSGRGGEGGGDVGSGGRGADADSGDSVSGGDTSTGGSVGRTGGGAGASPHQHTDARKVEQKRRARLKAIGKAKGRAARNDGGGRDAGADGPARVGADAGAGERALSTPPAPAAAHSPCEPLTVAVHILKAVANPPGMAAALSALHGRAARGLPWLQTRARIKTSLISQPRPVPPATHVVTGKMRYDSVEVPVQVPLSLFPEEVGEYSLTLIFATFRPRGHSIRGPHHPHLFTNGQFTHPVTLIFNAMVTQKRVLFAAHTAPAKLVVEHVLSACALASGCGTVLRRFYECAVPYATLADVDGLAKMPSYVAGVTNPRFRELPVWDVLCDVDSGRITVSDAAPPVRAFEPKTMLAAHPPHHRRWLLHGTHARARKSVPCADAWKPGDEREDAPEIQLMDMLLGIVAEHGSEDFIRRVCVKYVHEFVLHTAVHERSFYGGTDLAPIRLDGAAPAPVGDPHPQSDLDDATLRCNAMRAEGWRDAPSYRAYLADSHCDCLARARHRVCAPRRIPRLLAAPLPVWEPESLRAVLARHLPRPSRSPCVDGAPAVGAVEGGSNGARAGDASGARRAIEGPPARRAAPGSSGAAPGAGVMAGDGPPVSSRSATATPPFLPRSATSALPSVPPCTTPPPTAAPSPHAGTRVLETPRDTGGAQP
ncbi:hypothetical protein MSPP1_003402 [Malassezia sp. CBS 17886]|nr:hypothetical protein MSPP1_003402 [Malassezia sp. CBS 17886]